MPASDVCVVHGRCHCGGLSLRFSVASDLSATQPRACDCSFCCKHGAAWVSDPAGRLDIEAQEAFLSSYRQGSDLARFLVCGRCGVLVAVVFEDQTATFGAVNARCLESSSEFGATVSASPELLGASEKVKRWQQVWTPHVEISLIRF